MQQQHGRPTAADNGDNARATGLDLGSLEAVEHYAGSATAPAETMARVIGWAVIASSVNSPQEDGEHNKLQDQA